uniref:V-SNARE domain-containing protein n=1 Tax=Syphacia muris TaxID=451379 RepID=A0A0N5AKL0_9BILA
MNGVKNGGSLAVLQRGLEALNEVSPEVDDNIEEIRKLDSQLDHLNHYMDKVEERIKAHNAKLMDTLKHQREEREKRRRSFHERLALTQQEDDDFQKQLSSILNRVDISKNRASVYDIISNMEIPKVNGQ